MPNKIKTKLTLISSIVLIFWLFSSLLIVFASDRDPNVNSPYDIQIQIELIQNSDVGSHLLNNYLNHLNVELVAPAEIYVSIGNVSVLYKKDSLNIITLQGMIQGLIGLQPNTSKILDFHTNSSSINLVEGTIHIIVFFQSIDPPYDLTSRNLTLSNQITNGIIPIPLVAYYNPISLPLNSTSDNILGFDLVSIIAVILILLVTKRKLKPQKK